ncbi:MAG TPA: tRNA (adenosine(37)-N6)-threonylcarbamoyltransferase complex ATPase subunit type 1 TsaE [Actinomycetota bacterium]|nr:tRNA (adenosine(37)-N6)-threonylcarbamoyltransferase complex ATPase subunit type 1 TsaE [Actinomycetota bacterium]
MGRVLELAAATAEDTRGVGAALAPLLRPGDAVALTGELGAGKTTFVQGVARGAGYDGPVASPTYTLVREYRAGRLRLEHVDLYRLDRVQEVVDLGLHELLEPDGVLLVEWGDVVEALLPPDHLVVELTVPGDDEDRRIVLRPLGPGWTARWEWLEQAVDPWRAPA